MAQKKSTYYIKYSILFALSGLVAYAMFIYYGKGFLAKGDGFKQHYMSLIYYARFLRTVAHNIFIEHKFEIPTYTLGIGYGGDIVSTLSYYVLGNPITIFSALVPDKWMHIFYYAVMVIRLYLSGAAFSFYCFYKEKRAEHFPVLVAAIMYVFCTYNLHAATIHPYFSVPMIWTPLLFVGIEKIIKEKKHLLFIVFVALAALSNFYFFYMEVIFVIIYGIYNVCTRCDDKIRQLLLMLRDGVIGCLIAAPVLLPTVFKILSDPRTKSEYKIVPVYNLDYYRRLLQSIFLSGDVGYWALPGTTFLTVLAVIYVFSKRGKYKGQKIAFLAAVVAFSIPYFGYVLNGMSYVSNRWSWMFVFICCFIVYEYLSDLVNHENCDIKMRWIITAVFSAIVGAITLIYSGDRNRIDVFYGIAFVFALLIFETFYIKRNVSGISKICIKGAILGLVIASLGIHGYLLNSVYYDMYADSYFGIDEDVYSKAEASTVAEIKDIYGNKDFYRISGGNFTDNQPLLHGISSTQYYWSLSDSSSYEFLREMGVPILSNYHFRGLNGRTTLNSLLGVEYFIEKNKKGLPYGVTKQKSDNKLKYYQSEYALPLIYAYDSVVSKELFDELEILDRQELMLDAAVVEKEIDGIESLNEETSFEGTSIPMPIDIETEGDISFDDQRNMVQVGADGGVMHISFDGMKECETYLCINGLKYVAPMTSDSEFINALSKPESDYLSIKVKAKQGEEDFSSTSIKTSDIYYKWTNDMHDFVVNSGYSDDVTDGFDISFGVEGTYSFSHMAVKCQPMESVLSAISNRTNGIEMVTTYDNDNAAYAISEIRSDIKLDSDKLVVISLPYDNGWTAYIDGKKTELNKVNVMLMGTFMSKGNHELVLKYHTPGLLAGFILSIITVTAIIICICCQKFYTKKNEQ